MTGRILVYPLAKNARLVARLAEGVHERRGARAAAWLDRELGRYTTPLLDAGVPHETMQLAAQVGLPP